MKLILSAEANKKINALVGSCKEEVAWFGHVETVDGGYLVKDIVVPKQEISPAAWECDEEDVANAMMDLHDSLGIAPNMCYMGHSHVNMGVTPSTVDINYIKETMEDETFLLTSIHNKKGDVSALCTIKAHGFTASSSIGIEHHEEENSWATEILKKMIKPKKYGLYASPYWNKAQYQHVLDVNDVNDVNEVSDDEYIVVFNGAKIDDLEKAFDNKILFTYNVDEAEDKITAYADFNNATALEDFVSKVNVGNDKYSSHMEYSNEIGVDYA